MKYQYCLNSLKPKNYTVLSIKCYKTVVCLYVFFFKLTRLQFSASGICVFSIYLYAIFDFRFFLNCPFVHFFAAVFRPVNLIGVKMTPAL